MDIPGTSSNFLDSLLDQMSFPLPVIAVDPTPIQDSPLLSLPDKVLEQILSQIPLKERVLYAGSTCRRLRDSTKKSITSIEFYKEELDGIKENALKYFLNIYGGNITHMNFDLFRSSSIEQCSQWNWRQSVVTSVSICRNLKELSILVCNRHRLRDNDLITIFRQSPHLKAISVDAQYINGHCFLNAPAKLERLELEMCYRISDGSLKNLFHLKHLKTLHVSQLLILKDSVVFGIVSQLKSLEDLSIVSHPDSVYKDLTGTGLAMLGKLRHLKSLALEGLSAVTDRFLTEFSDNRCPAVHTLESLSLAFCFNFSGSGLSHLSQFVSLRNLNLEGCSKRDISVGLEVIAKEGRLVRILLAERCKISPPALLRVVYHSPGLRLLDITGNPDIVSWQNANLLIRNWSQRGLHRLNVLTDIHTPWNVIAPPPPNANGVIPVQVFHVALSLVPMSEIMPGCCLTPESVNQLPPGILSPKLRRGNRYRMLWSSLGPGREGEEKENYSPRNSESPEQPLLSPMLLQIPNDFNAPLPDVGQPFGNIGNAPPGLSPNVFSKDAMLDFNGPLSPLNGMQNSAPFGHPMKLPSLLSPGNSINPDLSLEMLTMLMGLDEVALPMPGCFQAAPPSRRSGGAPRPPVEIPEQPKIHYTRGPRSKRRSFHVNRKPASRQHDVRFDDGDFPPLGAN